MESIRVGLVQLPWLGERAAMKTAYQTLVMDAVSEGAQLVCLPELSLSPYFPGARQASGFDWAEPLPGGESDRFFSELARTYAITLVGSLFIRTSDGHHYNTAVIYGPQGNLIGATRKVHIPHGPGYHETDYFEAGDSYPHYDIGPLKLATPTCYDQWFPELARIHSLKGAEFIYYPTAIGSEPTDPNIDTAAMWQTVMRGHAIANGIFVGAANRVGTENGVHFYGSSFICDPMGQILAQAGRSTTAVIVADLNPYTLEHWRELFPLLQQRQPDSYHELLGVPVQPKE